MPYSGFASPHAPIAKGVETLKPHPITFLTLLTGVAGAVTLPAWSEPPPKALLPARTLRSASAQKMALAQEFGRLPLSFETNQGQTDTRVRFLAHTQDGTLFLTPSEAVFSMSLPVKSVQRSMRQNSAKRQTMRRTTQIAVRMQMAGANPKATLLQQQPLAGRINYFLGRDPGKWQQGVPTFGRVGFHNVYPGVDLVYYGNQKHLEYDFVVAPHADPQQIKLHFAGAQGVRIDTAGDLTVRTQGRELKWRKPTVYQQDASGKHAVTAQFRLKRLPNGQAGVRFALGHYDPARPLIIDPVLLYSTYLGGNTGIGHDGDAAKSIAVDGNGSAYIVGYTHSLDFPTTSGAFQSTRSVAETYPAAFVTKLNPTGTAVVYSTYLSGTDSFGSFASGIAIDSNGNAYVTGQTYSNDFPTTEGAFQRVMQIPGSNFGNSFVTKLNPTGSALVYSTYLGGGGGKPGFGDSATGIAIDSSGNAYITGNAYSTNFPTTPGAVQRVNNAAVNQNSNPFVTKLNSTGTALLYSTYLGGSTFDFVFGIAIDGSGSAYIAGATNSPNFPTTPGAFQSAKQGGQFAQNAFVTKLNPSGTALVYSTYLGGSSGTSSIGDEATAIVIDSSGNAYIAGSTSSQDFPTTPGALQRVNRAATGTDSRSNSSAFVTKLNATGTALIYSTFLGGTPPGAGVTGIVIDAHGSAYVTGQTSSSDFPTTPGAFQRVIKSDTGNLFLSRLNPAGTALLYSTYLGGSFRGLGTDTVWGDGATGIAIDRSGNAYVLGRVYSTDFPTTPGAFQATNHASAGSTNGTVTKLSPIPTFPDFNNDGNVDLLLQNTTTGQIGSWYQRGRHQVGGAPFSLIPPSDFDLVGIGDFSANGANTLVLQSRTTRQVALWYTGGTNNTAIAGGVFVNKTPESGWKVVGVGDFNGDGKSDLVFQNQTSNQLALWFMNGSSYQGGLILPSKPSAGWTVVGVGEFNGDGFADLVFQNQTTGQIARWYMNGVSYVGGTILPVVPGAGWKIVGVGDYNGDGIADLLLQNQTSNQAMVWYLNLGGFQSSDDFSLNPPAGWKIVGPR